MVSGEAVNMTASIKYLLIFQLVHIKISLHPLREAVKLTASNTIINLVQFMISLVSFIYHI